MKFVAIAQPFVLVDSVTTNRIDEWQRHSNKRQRLCNVTKTNGCAIATNFRLHKFLQRCRDVLSDVTCACCRCCSVLQCVAVCCSVLQCVAECAETLPFVWVTLPFVYAICSDVIIRLALHWAELLRILTQTCGTDVVRDSFAREMSASWADFWCFLQLDISCANSVLSWYIFFFGRNLPHKCRGLLLLLLPSISLRWLPRCVNSI